MIFISTEILMKVIFHDKFWVNIEEVVCVV